MNWSKKQAIIIRIHLYFTVYTYIFYLKTLIFKKKILFLKIKEY